MWEGVIFDFPFGSLKFYVVSPFGIQTCAKFEVFLTLPVWLRKLAQKWYFFWPATHFEPP